MNNCVISINKCRDKDSLEYYTSKIDSIQNGIDKVNTVYANLESIINSGGKLLSREYYRQVASLEQVTGWYMFETEVLPRRTSLESLSTTRGYISTEDLKASMEGLGKWLMDLIRKLIDWIKSLFGFGKKQEAASTSVKESIKATSEKAVVSTKKTDETVNKVVEEIAKEAASETGHTDKSDVVRAKEQAEKKIQEVVEEKIQEAVRDKRLNMANLSIGDQSSLTDSGIVANMQTTYNNLKNMADQASMQIKRMQGLVKDIDETKIAGLAYGRDLSEVSEEEITSLYQKLLDTSNANYIKFTEAKLDDYVMITRRRFEGIDLSGKGDGLLISTLALAGDRYIGKFANGKLKKAPGAGADLKQYVDYLKSEDKNGVYIAVQKANIKNKYVGYKYERDNDLYENLQKLSRWLYDTIDKISVPNIEESLYGVTSVLENYLKAYDKSAMMDKQPPIGMRHLVECIQFLLRYLAHSAYTLSNAFNNMSFNISADFFSFIQNYNQIRSIAAKEVLAKERAERQANKHKNK